ncbi:MAG TPA: hypothetical protein V6D46_07125 [Coleofasciculaceae cyanobacterium]
MNGATFTPCRRNQAQSAVVTQLFPAFDDVPKTAIDFTEATDYSKNGWAEHRTIDRITAITPAIAIVVGAGLKPALPEIVVVFEG